MIVRTARPEEVARLRALVRGGKRSVPRVDHADTFAALWRRSGLLVMPVREYRFAPPRRWRFDFAWPAARIAVEVDGGQWAPRGGRHAGDADREKMNVAASHGWRVFRFSPAMLRRDPDGCVARVGQALAVAR